MKKRRNFSKTVIEARFAHAGGRCEWVNDATKVRCNTVLSPGRWHCDHDDPDGMTGKPVFANARALCLDHHKLKTAVDVGNISKAKARHVSEIRPKIVEPKPIESAPMPISQRTADKRNREPKIQAVGLSNIARRFGAK